MEIRIHELEPFQYYALIVNNFNLEMLEVEFSIVAHHEFFQIIWN